MFKTAKFQIRRRRASTTNIPNRQISNPPTPLPTYPNITLGIGSFDYWRFDYMDTGGYGVGGFEIKRVWVPP